MKLPQVCSVKYPKSCPESLFQDWSINAGRNATPSDSPLGTNSLPCCFAKWLRPRSLREISDGLAVT